MRVAGTVGGAVVAVARALTRHSKLSRPGDRRRDLRDDDLALAGSDAPSGRGVSARGSSPRPGLRDQGRPPVLDLYAGRWDGKTLRQTGLKRDLRRRKDGYPGPSPLPPHARPRLHTGTCTSSMNTTVAAPLPTSPAGTSTEPRSSPAANRPPASNPSLASSTR